MKTSFHDKLNENKYIIISALVSASGLLARGCQSDVNAFGLPMCGDSSALFMGANAAHAHCVGCYVAAVGLVSAFVAIVVRQIETRRSERKLIRVKA